MSKPGRKRVIVYTRVSVIDPKRPGYSTEVQPDRVEEFVKAKGWEVVATYSDPDRTGRNSRRPGLQQAIRDIKVSKADAIAVQYLDRLYRNLASLLKLMYRPQWPRYCPLVGQPDRGKGRIPLPHPIESHAARLIAVLYSQKMSDSDISDYVNTHDFTLPDGQVVHFRAPRFVSTWRVYS